MSTKKCSDRYNYGCTLEVDLTEEPQHFYYKKTHSGDYFLNTCKECVKRHHRELYASGPYNNHKTKYYVSSDYGVLYEG